MRLWYNPANEIGGQWPKEKREMVKSNVLVAAMGIAGVFVSAAALAAPTMGVVDGKYVIDVPANEEHTLTADDVAAMMNEDNAAYPLAKKGEGTLIVGAVMAN